MGKNTDNVVNMQLL